MTRFITLLAFIACAPAAQAPAPSTPYAPASLADARHYTLARINHIRASHGRAPLVQDASLDHFAQVGSAELARNHKAHGHFKNAALLAGCRAIAENQGDPDGWIVLPYRSQIDQVLDMMMHEGPGGGHYENILDERWHRVGVGIVNPGGQMYFTSDFCP